MGFWEPLFFWILAIGAVVTSVAVIRFKNPLYSALSLVLDFLCFAGLYALLSAHFIAVTQVLVYTGAIMVLFLFIIMLLNLKEDELEQFDLRVHYLLAVVSAAGLLFFLATSIAPLGSKQRVVDGRAKAQEVYKAAKTKHDEQVKKADAETDEKKKKAMVLRNKQTKPQYIVKTRTAISSLYLDLNEAGLEQVNRRKVNAYRSGRITPASGKYARFDESKPMIIPPAMTGLGLKTERGEIRARKSPSFGTIQPISVLIVNRFVVPFELTAILLLAAIIGAMIIAKRRL